MPGAPVPGPAACSAGTPISPAKWRRLTTAQYRNTVRDLLGLDADVSQFLHDTRTGPFATNAGLPPQDADVDRYRESAEALAGRAVADLPRLLKCDTRATGEDACATRFIADFALRAWRRPPASEETGELTKLYQLGKADGFANGIRLVVEAVLQSPSFLYLTEFGVPATGGALKLTGHEVASRVSYLLTNSMPDAELFAAAKDGRLDGVEGLRAQAQRLMTGERFLDAVAGFHAELAHVARLADEGEVSKAPTQTEWDGALRAAMLEDARKFVHHVMAKGPGTVEALLTSTTFFPNAALAKIYGGTPAADGRLEVTNGTRSGLLTLAGALASEPALPTPYAPVHRGRLVRVNLLCEEIPPPTVMVEFKAPPGADKMSEQELLRVHQENPTCTPCHRMMDSIGFGFSAYDGVGRHRTTGRDGKPIDTSGEIVGLEDGRFDGVRALTAKLAKSPAVRACMARQWFRFTLGREVSAGDACAGKPVTDALSAGAGDVRQAVLALITSDVFRFRRGN